MKFNEVECTVDTGSLKNGENSGTYILPMGDIDWSIDNIKPEDAEGILNLFIEVDGDDIICSGKLDAVFLTPCARCLEPTPFRVTAEIFREYMLNEYSPHGENVEFLVIDHGKFPIIDAIREAVILSIPGKPLCGPDCSGINYIT